MRSCKTLALVLAAMLSSCGALPIIDGNGQDPADCKPACENLEKMECEFYDSDCVDFCVHALSEPIRTIKPKCVKNATTCEEAENCE